VKQKKRGMVKIVARQGSNLEVLSQSDNLLRNTCGNIGTLIVKKVIDGRGVAVISRNELLLALDTKQGTNILQDNFELLDAESERPLLFTLLGECK